MSLDPDGELSSGERRQASTAAAGMHAVIARLVERERTRDRAARHKLERRRAAAERARQFERAALEAIIRD